MNESPRKRDSNKGTIARSKAFESLSPSGPTASLRVMRTRVGEPEGELVGTFLSRSGVARLLGVSPNTATKDLKLLCQEGLIERVEPSTSTRSHYFVLKSKARETT